MGWFNRMFGEDRHKEVMHLEVSREPRTQKEQYQFNKVRDEWEAEWDAEDDPKRIDKAIQRHQKKSQKRGGGEA